MQTLRSIAASIMLVCLTNAAAMGFEPMTANVRVSNGSLYDYVIIGERPLATDGYDNAYDTISPGNLNADMGQPYVSVVIRHPEYKPAMRDLRGDVRSMAKKQEWRVTVSASLGEGAPLTLGLQKSRSTLPRGMKLILRDDSRKIDVDLAAESCTIPAPGPGKSTQLTIIAEQP